MKKLTIGMIALAMFALLLAGCDNGNVSNRNDGMVDGTNSTAAATFPSPSESNHMTEANHGTSTATDGTSTTTEPTTEETNQQATTSATGAAG